MAAGGVGVSLAEARRLRYHSDPVYRERVKSYRREYAKTDKFRSRVRAYSQRRRDNPLLKPVLMQYQHAWKKANRIKFMACRAANRSGKSGVECDKPYLLTLTEVTHCCCCGAELQYEVQSNGHTPHWATPSMDRLDPSKGYISGNVYIICWRCNILKKDGTLAEFEAIAKYMRERL